MNRRYPPHVFVDAYVHAVNANNGPLRLPGVRGVWEGFGPAGQVTWVGGANRSGLVVVTGVVGLVMGHPHRDEEYRWVDRAYHVGSWTVRYQGPERRRLVGPPFIVGAGGHPEDAYRARAVAEDWGPVLRVFDRVDEIEMRAWQNVANSRR